MSNQLNDFANLLSSDNTKTIKFTLVFFLFFIGLSQNIFENLFGCNIKQLFRNNILRHSLCFLFLYLLFDYATGLNKDMSQLPNPLVNLGISGLIYSLVILLFQTNVFYIYFISILVIILIILDKIKNYFAYSVKDQEILQENLSFIYKLNNVLVIIGILTIIIGILSTTNLKKLSNIFLNKKC
tara:strand:+ start:53 stop:604 length:552 start_codon:yes stop_codon:yes gene_type:complete